MRFASVRASSVIAALVLPRAATPDEGPSAAVTGVAHEATVAGRVVAVRRLDPRARRSLDRFLERAAMLRVGGIGADDLDAAELRGVASAPRGALRDLHVARI